MAKTISQCLDALKWVMFEKGLSRQWNELKAITHATIGSNVTISGGRTTLGLLDTQDDNDLLSPTVDSLGQNIDPLFEYPDPGRDRLNNAHPGPTVGGGFRY